MKIVEIFNSIEGEGKRAGIPCTFIRLYGCNLRCSYCDSKYSWAGGDYSVMTITEVLEKVNSFKCPYVTITGGEPLFQEGIEILLKNLVLAGYEINVETNGSKDNFVLSSNIFYTVDYKTDSSKMNKNMKLELFSKLTEKDVIKCVVSNQEDLDQVLQFFDTRSIKAQIFISPVYGKIAALDIVNYVKKHKLWNWRVQLQLHKYIWNPEERGV